jgi:trimeric autotransporter adhesin
MKMSGLLKALPLTLALAAASIVTTSCGSSSGGSNPAAIRVINAIPDGPALDIDINGSNVITNLPYGTIQPAKTPAGYVTVPSGNVVIQGFATGTTTNPIAPIGTITLTGAVDYTVVAVGLELNESAPLLVADDNTPPMGTNVEYRMINASNSSPLGGLDMYVVAPGTDITNFTPQFSGIGNNQASTYQSFPFLTGGYTVIVTANGGKTPIITQASVTNAASITTFVILDNAGGNSGISTTPLVLDDLN